MLFSFFQPKKRIFHVEGTGEGIYNSLTVGAYKTSFPLKMGGLFEGDLHPGSLPPH